MTNLRSDTQELRVGVVGLGSMGDAFAGNLLTDGHSVMVVDRKTELERALTEMGAVAAKDLAEIGQCGIVLTSLPDDSAVTEVTEALIPVLQRGAMLVSTSTISARSRLRLGGGGGAAVAGSTRSESHGNR